MAKNNIIVLRKKILFLVGSCFCLFAIVGLSSCWFSSSSGDSKQVETTPTTVTTGLNKCLNYITKNGLYASQYYGMYAYNSDANKVVFELTYNVTYQGVTVANYSTQYFLYAGSSGNLSFTDNYSYQQYYNDINNGTYNGKVGPI